jgi:hypothetical protein
LWRLWIVWISAAVFVFAGAEIDIHDVPYALDVNHLSHRLTTGVDRNHVIAWIDNAPRSAASEESAASTAFSSATAGAARAADRGFSGTKVDFPRRTAASLSASSSAAGKTSACLHSFAQRAHTRRVSSRPHGIHAIAHRGDGHRVCPRWGGTR